MQRDAQRKSPVSGTPEQSEPTTMRNDGADVTLPGCLLLRFGQGGRCLGLREYWHFEQGRLDPPPEWGT